MRSGIIYYNMRYFKIPRESANRGRAVTARNARKASARRKYSGKFEIGGSICAELLDLQTPEIIQIRS